MGKIKNLTRRFDRVANVRVEKKWSAHRLSFGAKAGPEVTSIDSSQTLIMYYQLTELLVAVVEGQ